MPFHTFDTYRSLQSHHFKRIHVNTFAPIDLSAVGLSCDELFISASKNDLTGEIPPNVSIDLSRVTNIDVPLKMIPHIRSLWIRALERELDFRPFFRLASVTIEDVNPGDLTILVPANHRLETFQIFLSNQSELVSPVPEALKYQVPLSFVPRLPECTQSLRVTQGTGRLDIDHLPRLHKLDLANFDLKLTCSTPRQLQHVSCHQSSELGSITASHLSLSWFRDDHSETLQQLHWSGLTRVRSMFLSGESLRFAVTVADTLTQLRHAAINCTTVNILEQVHTLVIKCPSLRQVRLLIFDLETIGIRALLRYLTQWRDLDVQIHLSYRVSVAASQLFHSRVVKLDGDPYVVQNSSSYLVEAARPFTAMFDQLKLDQPLQPQLSDPNLLQLLESRISSL